MTAADEGPENLTLRYLRGLDAKIDALADVVRELRDRTNDLTDSVNSLRADFNRMERWMARQQVRLDAHDDRLARVERRLGLIETAEPQA